MNKEFKARFDLRVDRSLKDRLSMYCKSKSIKISDAGREALSTYIDYRMFVNAVIENLQNPEFYVNFTVFCSSLPDDIKKPLEKLIGPEEEKLVLSTPKQLLKNIKVMTKQGQRTLKKLL
jgi:hypothetical protein